MPTKRPSQAAVTVPAAFLGVVTRTLGLTQHCTALTPADIAIVHATVEVQECSDAPMRQVTWPRRPAVFARPAFATPQVRQKAGAGEFALLNTR